MMDDDKIPWTGGISNRQILIDTIRSVAIWVVVFVLVFLLLWWAADFVPFINPRWKVPISSGLSAALVGPVNWWLRRR
jgi:hypothetical protein